MTYYNLIRPFNIIKENKIDLHSVINAIDLYHKLKNLDQKSKNG